MFIRVSAVLAILAIPAMADPGEFQKIRNKDSVTLVLPNGECEAKVVGRKLDQLTIKLKKKTDVCGERESVIVLSRADVRDVVDNRRRRAFDPGGSPAAVCAGLAAALIGAPAALALGETGHEPAALLVFVGSAIAGAALCRERSPRYTVFADRIASSAAVTEK